MRSGGDRRGNTRDRRARKLWLLAAYDPDLGPANVRCHLGISDRCRGVLDYESNVFLTQPEHLKHDRGVQVAGSYGGARRDKVEAREIRKGGYVPSVEVQRLLLGTPWMSEKGCRLSIPPMYAEYVGCCVWNALERAA